MARAYSFQTAKSSCTSMRFTRSRVTTSKSRTERLYSGGFPMEQVAAETGVGLVSYTITHHTRQSAVGLPFIEKRTYGGAGSVSAIIPAESSSRPQFLKLRQLCRIRHVGLLRGGGDRSLQPRQAQHQPPEGLSRQR